MPEKPVKEEKPVPPPAQEDVLGSKPPAKGDVLNAPTQPSGS